MPRLATTPSVVRRAAYKEKGAMYKGNMVRRKEFQCIGTLDDLALSRNQESCKNEDARSEDVPIGGPGAGDRALWRPERALFACYKGRRVACGYAEDPGTRAAVGNLKGRRSAASSACEGRTYGQEPPVLRNASPDPAISLSSFV